MAQTQKITPYLWFDNNAEEAVSFYISVFGDGKVLHTSRFDEAGSKVSGMPVGTVMVIEFELFGQKFAALNGGPVFQFNEAISFLVNCDTQEEIDKYWEVLSSDPKDEQCGWLKDKFGLSWQIVPKQLSELMSDQNAKKSGAVMQAMLQMKKIDIGQLQKAYERA